MRSASRLTALAAAIAVAVGAVVPLSASAANDREIAEADHFRRSMGLASGIDVARQSLADPDKYSDRRWGVPLTRAEATEMERRAAERPKVQPAIDYADAEASSAGMYLDQTKGAKPVFLFTRDIEKHREAIGKRLPEGIDFAVEKVDYSMNELSALQSRITDDIDVLTANGIPVAQVGVGVERNRVLVGLERATPGAREYLQDRYGPMVGTEFIGPSELDACNNRNDCRPIKGGLRIGRNGVFRCTSGFIGKRRDNGSHVVLTAGHCLTENGGVGECNPAGPAWQHHDDRFGCAKGHSLKPSDCDGNQCPADVGWIKTDATEDVHPRNKIMASDKFDLRSIERVLSGPDLAVNDVVCRAGGNNDPQSNMWKCGQIKKTCVDKPNGEGWTILCTATVAFDSLPGDSGGPYIRTDIYPPGVAIYSAVGIHSHSSDSGCDTCRSWFTKANRVENNSPADICTTGSC